MKTIELSLFALLISLSFISCSDNRNKFIEKDITLFSNYVDSIATVSPEKLAENWEDVEKMYSEKKLQAQSSAEVLSENLEFNKKVTAITAKYKEFKTEFQEERETIMATQQKINLRKSLFDGKEIGDDLNFAWVTKDNIVSVYETFISSVSNNRDTYTLEDWDEVKVLYNALDGRKNSLEKEGLSSSDTMKIAALNLKFTPMYTLYRIDEKLEENFAASQILIEN